MHGIFVKLFNSDRTYNTTSKIVLSVLEGILVAFGIHYFNELIIFLSFNYSMNLGLLNGASYCFNIVK